MYGVKPQTKKCSEDAKILAWSKFKVFADNKINEAKRMIFEFDSVENIVGKGKSAGYQHYYLFPQCLLPFQKQLHFFFT